MYLHRSENTLLKQSVPTTKEKNSNYLEVEKVNYATLLL